MPSIEKAQAKARLDDIGENKNLFTTVNLSILEKIFVQYGAEFALRVRELLNQKNNIGSGGLADSTDPEVTIEGSTATLRIRLNDYYDFVNKGVKGVKSSKNAPNSPYSFKNYGVPDSMKASLKKYINSGKAKVRTVRRDKAYGIGGERKGKRFTEEQTQVNTLGYMIKRFGVKKSGYLDQAFKEVFEGYEEVIAEAVGEDILLSFKGIKLGSK